jgi:uncharacterized membrane protein
MAVHPCTCTARRLFFNSLLGNIVVVCGSWGGMSASEKAVMRQAQGIAPPELARA